MIKSLRVLILAATFAAIVVPSVQAATYIVPTDAEMIQKSDDIVIATGVSSFVERNAHGGIVTRYTLRVDESLKGHRSAGDHLVLTERGGLLDGKIKYIPGTPEYEPGAKYLIFTETNNDFEPVTFGMALGQFFFTNQGSRKLLLRTEIYGFDGNLGGYKEQARDAGGFVTYIRGIVSQRISPLPTYFVAGAEPEYTLRSGKIESLATRTSYLMQQSGQGFRWSTPSATFVKSGSAVGPDGNVAVTQAFAEWNSTTSNIDYSDGGQDNTAMGGLTSTDGKNAILFNDPNNEVGSAAGIGGISAGGNPYTLDGETFWDMIEVDVVMNDGAFAQNCYNSVATHEIGHTLGFRHSDQPPSGGVTTTNAIMNSVVQCSWNGVLKTYDNDAASTVYGAGAVCSPPSITTQPQSKSVAVGTQTSLSVVASGSAPLTYQWYFGDSPNTSNPVLGATSSTISITPNSVGSGNYWVRVSNSCTSGPAANSNTATVTATCTNPSISNLSPSLTITGGQSTQLQVTTAGSATTFQWYVGTAPDRSQAIGGNSKTLNVTPSTTTNYWVEVSGPCGTPVQSSTITITVIPCADITVDAPTATPGIGSGKYTLNVNAFSTSTPLTFSWFKGGTPGFGGTPMGGGQSLNVTVTAVTGFWARVQNACGRVEYSSIITLAPCTLPTITTQPVDPPKINSNQTAPLSITVSAGATVKWFRGTVGDTTNQVGTGTAINTPALTANTQFWAQVTNSCGSISSRQVTVTVQQISELVSMLNGRFFVQVRYINQFENPPREGKLLGRSLSSTALSDTAIFTFGDPLVVELMVRLSDARPFENKIHLYLGGLSDVEFSVVVTDSLTGIIKEYRKPPNQLVGAIDRTSFPGGTSLLDGGVDALMQRTAMLTVQPNAEVSTIRLLNNRFQVRMRYKNQFTNPAGEGYMNTRSIASSTTTETAVFFFDENVGSVEWMVRFSDARPFAERIDFFHGGLSDVEFTVEVTDTVKGITREYKKGPFSLLGQVDRSSFTP
ncbi:MAG: M57 family metalloprotease [Acidobacteriota bacterium]